MIIKILQSNINLTFPSQIGMIERKEVDIGVTDFYSNTERAEVSDFSSILDYAELEIY